MKFYGRALLVLSALWGTFAHGSSYGIYDARAMAMGGSGVAVAGLGHAQFYNVALLAFHDENEENSLAGRFYFPLVSIQASEAITTVTEIDSDDLEDSLSDAVDAFNAEANEANAQEIVSATRNLNEAIQDLVDEDLDIDSFVGLSVSEPSQREGGSFFVGTRVVAGGRADISDTDLDLLEDYIEGLEFVASAGSRGVAHPELFNGDGSLVDPIDALNSSASARGAAIVEWGLSFAKEVQILGQPIAVGIAPKLMRVRAYETVLQLSEGGGTETSENDKAHITMNVDLGIASQLGEHFRLGIGVKDVVPKDFDTGLDGQVELRPRSRLGIAYVTNALQLGLDVDLNKNHPVGTESETQEIAIGGEWSMGSRLHLRVGYRHDLEGVRKDVISAGVGIRWRRFLMDFAYAQGDNFTGAAWQMGCTF